MTTKDTAEALYTGLSSIIKGKPRQLELLIVAYLTGGHLLLNDLPGSGKTTLAKTLARLVSSESQKEQPVQFKRIQCTPDLLPYDITGVDIFNPQTHSFDFIPGPIFCHILLADEINRTPPKVQSALLEAMAEKQVTQNGTTRKTDDTFFVLATQNPVETSGTYPLPSAQLDRFMMHISLGYPDEDSELLIMRQDRGINTLEHLHPVITLEHIRESRKEQTKVFCHPALEKALLRICRSTRKHPSIALGASTRAATHLLHAARTLALVRNRNWIIDTDVLDLAVPVLSHRLYLKDHTLNPETLIHTLAQDILNEMNRKTDWRNEPSSYEPHK